MLTEFPVVIELPVAWGEMDAFGHVNNTVYFRYIESGRTAYFDRLQLLEHMRETGVGPILGSVSCRFRLALSYPDTVSVGTRISEAGEDRFTMESRIISQQHKRLAAEAQSVIVMLDYRHHKKAALPAEIRRRIKLLETV